MFRIPFLITAIAALAALATTGTAAAAKTVSCGYEGYSYAGVMAVETESGISADIAAVNRPHITSGHVAAWVGVGGVGQGPGGSNEWLQAGISSVPGQGTQLYVEVALPHSTPRYHALPLALQIGRTYRIAVEESALRPGWWSVWVDGKEMTGKVHLPGSHDAWHPVATTESWDGGSPACNAFTFKFSNVRSKSAGPAWAPMQSSVIDAPGYRVTARSLAGFTAVGGRA